MVVGETCDSVQTSDCDSSTIDVITRDHFSGLHAAALMRTGRNTCAKRVANNGSTVRPAPPPLLRHLRQPELPEFAQLRRCLKLGVKLLKRASKRIRQAPHTSAPRTPDIAARSTTGGRPGGVRAVPPVRLPQMQHIEPALPVHR